MKFEWDENKNQSNIAKHDGVFFKEAKTIFLDPNLIRWSDDEHTNYTGAEDRFYALGKSIYKNLLLVCFCERCGDTIRIYSARYADKQEKEDYYASH